MAYQSNNMQSPCAEYLFKIQMIVSNSEFKNKELANKYETTEIKLEAEKYLRAELKQDSFESYNYDDKLIYQTLLDFGYPEDRIYLCLKNHFLIPNPVKAQLLSQARKQITDTYIEKNKYYRNLQGKPFMGTDDVKADRIFTIPDSFYEIYSGNGDIYKNQPIHEMDQEYQDLFINTPYYQQLITNFPNDDYLRYIGSKAIPLTVSRKARDGDIMKINSDKLSGYHRKFGNVTVSPDIVHLYANTYNQVRDYVYNTLRGDFSSIYPNYNNFIRFLTIYMSIGQTLNELMKKSSSMSYLNDTSANNYFMLYGLPSVVMEGQSMINFLKKLRLLLMDKGTNVVYRVKDYVGYKYTDIYSLIMVKQQVFEEGKPKYTYDEKGNATPLFNIVFRRMGTTADKTSYFKFRDENVEYDWRTIASGDPRWWWWNDPEIDSILYEMNYTLSNSKYIQLSTHMSMSDMYWQSIILLRGLLDNRVYTENTPLAINYDIGNVSNFNVFDAILALIVMMNWNMTLFNGRSYNGEFYDIVDINGKSACIDMLFNGLKDDGLTPEKLIKGSPFKVSDFNFNVKGENYDFYYNELPTYEYLNTRDVNFKEDLLDPIINNITKNVGERMMAEVRKLYDYLVDRLLSTRTIHEFRQVTETFKNLFLTNPATTEWYDGTLTNTLYLLSKKYDISENDLIALNSFCDKNADIPTFRVVYNNERYEVKLGDVLNTDAKVFTLEALGKDIHPFVDYPEFTENYYNAIDLYDSSSIMNSNLPSVIKEHYKGILKDKVMYDLNTTKNGPKSFEGLLMIHNPELYDRLMELRKNGDKLVLFMRAIVKSLESYTSSELGALTYSVIGKEEYTRILKEIISYFKSYMVEFTKEEFAFVMDGLFDNGGNSNMLRLYDEIHQLTINPIAVDSVALYDVTNNTMDKQFQDDNSSVMYDEAIIRTQAAYSYIKSLGYDILFDDGKKISKTEPSTITDDSICTGTMVSSGNTYTIIIPTSMIQE